MTQFTKPFKQKRVPKWLADLPPDQYTIKYLAKLTGKSSTSIHRTLNNLGLQKEYGENTYRNMVLVYYIWPGKL